ncbi:hypothetical protein LIP_0318 [Limnochorda pilosa]|uniref:HTH marR-type domain-containing protein n=1 Tax=Limnochorda pilosa TaxID=1555112 RepID=A0A0K2SGG5_LIMPI|nr:hypothetical protein LIP_0318 [Limnochorda pilosa]
MTAGAVGTRAGDVRTANRRLLLELIEREGPVSRADLARRTGLSQPSVSEIVEELLETGLVVWGGEGASTGGRRPRLLHYNPRRGTVLAVDLGGTRMEIGAFTLDGAPVAAERFSARTGEDGPDVLERLARSVQRLRDRLPQGSPEVLGMGVAAPGVTDTETGEVTLAPAVGWLRTQVRTLLQSKMGLPVAVDNDVNAAALAEWRFGRGAQFGTFAFVSLGTGVGMGIILRGEVHRGAGNLAGEIGYMPLGDAGGTDERSFGGLEQRLSLSALARDYSALMALPEPGAEAVDTTVAAMLEACTSGEPRARRFVEERMSLLARALLSIHLVLAPEVIFLGGPVSPHVPALLPMLEQEFAKLSPFRPRVEPSSLQHRAGLVGACALAADQAKELLMAGR